MNDTRRVPFFDIDLADLTIPQGLRLCEQAMEDRKGGYVCFVNVHLIAESLRRPEIKEVLQKAFFSFADGMPLVWFSGLFGHKLAWRVSGPDFMPMALRKWQDLNHGFIGGIPEQAQAIAERHEIKATIYSPPVRPFSPENAREDWQNFLGIWPEAYPPKVVWVGLGAPKQECWMNEVAKLAPETLFFGVGAAFDFLAGTKPRAPAWMRTSGLEWLYRLASEPRRLFARYFVTNSYFLWRIGRKALSKRL